MMPTLGIVIVNWNAGEWLYRCVASLFAATQTRFQLASVVVVDNASALYPISGLVRRYPKVTVLHNDRNRGFAAACNQGAVHLETDFILFLNPDATVEADTIDKAVGFLADSAHQGIAVCGVRMVDVLGRPSVCGSRFPTVRLFVAEMFGLGRLMGRKGVGRLLTGKELSGSQLIDQVTGAFFLVRTPVFRELGGFDERFFVYFEELDFSLRAHHAGYRSYHLSEAQAVHIGGVCSDRDLASRLFYSLHSRLLYGRKHFRSPARQMLIASTLVVEPFARLFKGLCSGSWRTVVDTWKAYRRLYAVVLGGRLNIDF